MILPRKESMDAKTQFWKSCICWKNGVVNQSTYSIHHRLYGPLYCVLKSSSIALLLLVSICLFLLPSTTRKITANLVWTSFTLWGHSQLCFDQFAVIFNLEIDLQTEFKLHCFSWRFLAISSLDVKIVWVNNLLNLFLQWVWWDRVTEQ